MAPLPSPSCFNLGRYTTPKGTSVLDSNVPMTHVPARCDNLSNPDNENGDELDGSTHNATDSNVEDTTSENTHQQVTAR